MDSLVFRCTKTGSNVQVRLEESTVPDRADSYEAVTCLACGRVHLVNKTTGKTLSDKEK
jgi:RNase P subunit RPR2